MCSQSIRVLLLSTLLVMGSGVMPDSRAHAGAVTALLKSLFQVFGKQADNVATISRPGADAATTVGEDIVIGGVQGARVVGTRSIDLNRNRDDDFQKLKDAAEDGDIKAQYYLGEAYFLGANTEKNFEEAAKWCRLSAEQGYFEAQYLLGYMYRRGIGVPEDSFEAAKWKHLAAEQGMHSAQFVLAQMYETGEGVPQSYKEAYIWYSLSAAGGETNGPRWRDIIAGKLSPSVLAAAQEEAVQRYQTIGAKIN